MKKVFKKLITLIVVWLLLSSLFPKLTANAIAVPGGIPGIPSPGGGFTLDSEESSAIKDTVAVFLIAMGVITPEQAQSMSYTEMIGAMSTDDDDVFRDQLAQVFENDIDSISVLEDLLEDTNDVAGKTGGAGRSRSRGVDVKAWMNDHASEFADENALENMLNGRGSMLRVTMYDITNGEKIYIDEFIGAYGIVNYYGVPGNDDYYITYNVFCGDIGYIDLDREIPKGPNAGHYPSRIYEENSPNTGFSYFPSRPYSVIEIFGDWKTETGEAVETAIPETEMPAVGEYTDSEGNVFTVGADGIVRDSAGNALTDSSGNVITINNDGSVTYEGDTHNVTYNLSAYSGAALADLLERIIGILEGAAVIEDDKEWVDEFVDGVVIEGDLGGMEGFLLDSEFATRFPFCLPFDFVRCMRLFDVKPKEPVFEVSIPIPEFEGIDYSQLDREAVSNAFHFTVDLSDKKFELVAIFTRWFTLIGFSYALIILTAKIVKGGGS